MSRLLVLLTLALLAACPSAPAAPAPTHDTALEPTPLPVPTAYETRTLVVPAIAGVVSSGWAPDWSGYAGTSVGCMRSTGAGRFAVAPALADGDRLLDFAVAMIGTGSADVTITSLAVAPNGDRFLGTLGSLTQANVPGAWNDYAIDLADTTVTGGASHWLEFVADGPGLCVGAVRLTYDRPTP